MELPGLITLLQDFNDAAEILVKLQDEIMEIKAMNMVLVSMEERERNYICLPDMLNMTELCKWFKVSYVTMKKIVDLPGFPKLPIGETEFRFNKEAVRKWIMENPDSEKIKNMLRGTA